MNHTNSGKLWKEANEILVGGVNSPVRAFKGVGGDPFFVRSGEGAWIKDVDGNHYVDYVLSWGPLILGHAHPEVTRAVSEALHRGASFGIPTEAEIRLAEAIQKFVPSMEKIRLVNSGTEATMSAIRLARGYTGRDLIVKIEGCYHGHVDSLLVAAGSGLTTLGVPNSPGITEAQASNTLLIPYNSPEAARTVFEAHTERIAALIIEPVPGNMGVVLPEPGYLELLRELTHEHGSLLIFDEVMSGFRVSLGGAQEKYGVQPDITCLGKVIGGGLPCAAYGGPAEIMNHLSPMGPVYQAGTLSGNPLATAAGLATLEVLQRDGLFDTVVRQTEKLAQGLLDVAKEAGVPVCGVQTGTMACLFFQEGPVRNYAEATASDTTRYAAFFRGMLDRGFYFAPSQFEACFLSCMHDDVVIDATLSAASEVFKGIGG